MKIIELLDKSTNEGIGSAIAGAAKGVGKAAMIGAKGADEFTKGATSGKLDVGGTIRKYENPEWRNKNERGRGVGRGLPDDVILRNVIRAEYNIDKSDTVLLQDIYDTYAVALKTGKKEEVDAVINQYRSHMRFSDIKDPNREALKRLLSQA